MNISPDNLDDPDRDLFVMSKGHSVEAYYAVLAAKGFLAVSYTHLDVYKRQQQHKK